MNGNEMESLQPTSGNHLVIMVTAASEKQAKRICDILLESKVIACANIIRGVQSFFWWKGKVDRSRELLLVMKSRSELLEEIVRLVRENHSYDVPEVIALPLVGGDPEYLRWIDDSVEIHRKGDTS
jgi:periplasmic divalent cation tolerance protein